METQIYNAIWEMLASGFEEEEIKEGFEKVNINCLIDIVIDDYEKDL